MAKLRVAVYKNLHKSTPGHPIYSLKDISTGKVVAWSGYVYLEDVVFKVSEKGRQRVIKNRKKEVHAYVVGTWTGEEEEVVPPLFTRVRYNPYETPTFVKACDNQTPVTQAPAALLCDSGVWVP